jgi:predicted ArsR family transcriptional regulator
MPSRTRADGEATREQIKAALRTFQAHGKHPTARELAAQTGISHYNVRHHVQALLADGAVVIDPVPARSIRREIVLVEPPEGD